MSFAGAYRLVRRLPSPLRNIVRLISNRYFERTGYPLTGVAAGLRVVGTIYGSYLDGSYEPGVASILTQIIKPGSICVDVGAHLGYFTLLMAKCAGAQGRVIAFEAYPPNAEQLRANVKVNHYQNRVRIENVAISDGTLEKVTIFSGRAQLPAEYNIVGHDITGRATVPVMQLAATSLDAYFSHNTRIDLIKMDIEGAEADALKGMRQLLRRCQPIVLVEFHDEAGWAGRAELIDAGYTLFDIQSGVPVPIDLDAPARVYHCLAVPPEQAKKVGS